MVDFPAEKIRCLRAKGPLGSGNQSLEVTKVQVFGWPKSSFGFFCNI